MTALAARPVPALRAAAAGSVLHRRDTP